MSLSRKTYNTTQLSSEAIALIDRITDFDLKYPGALEPEFLDFLDVVEMGRIKHPAPPKTRANWLTENGSTTSHNDMHDRMFHHLARSFANNGRLDDESGLEHLLHMICRGIMTATRIKRGIKNAADL